LGRVVVDYMQTVGAREIGLHVKEMDREIRWMEYGEVQLGLFKYYC